MKLLIVSSWFPYPPDNGSKLRAYSLLRELSRHHRLTLLSFREEQSDEIPEPLGNLCAEVRMLPGNPFKPQRPLSSAAFFSRLPRSYAETYSPCMQSMVDQSLPEHDVAVAFQIGSALYFRGRFARPRLLEEIELGVLKAQYVNAVGPWNRVRQGATWIKYSRFVRELVSEFDRSTVVSEIERDHLGRAGCDLAKVRILPNGTDIPEVLPAVARQMATLIYPGSLTYSANLDAVRFFLSEIWPLIRQGVPDAKLVVTGSIEGVPIEQLPHREDVVFTGHLASIDEPIAASAACIVPLRIGGGTRLKILQSMALGTPVVSTSKGAEGLELRPDHDILIGDTPDQFALQVRRLLFDPQLRDRLSNNGRHTIRQHYSWTSIGAELERILQETVAAFRSRPAR